MFATVKFQLFQLSGSPRELVDMTGNHLKYARELCGNSISIDSIQQQLDMVRRNDYVKVKILFHRLLDA